MWGVGVGVILLRKVTNLVSPSFFFPFLFTFIVFVWEMCDYFMWLALCFKWFLRNLPSWRSGLCSVYNCPVNMADCVHVCPSAKRVTLQYFATSVTFCFFLLVCFPCLWVGYRYVRLFVCIFFLTLSVPRKLNCCCWPCAREFSGKTGIN